MNFKRISRILVCLLLICCLTFHAMIPKAEASSIGAAATIVKASTVTCNPYIIAGATLIALGVYAGVETGAFETVANNCVSALEAAGTWIKDGAMELLRTEDADGNASYYVDSGLMEFVRSWIFDTNVVTSTSGIRTFLSQGSVYKSYTMGSEAVILRWCSYWNYSATTLQYEVNEIAVSLVPNYQFVTGTQASSYVTSGGKAYWYKRISGESGYIDNNTVSINNWLSGTAAGYTYIPGRPSIQDVFTGYGFSEYVTDYDASLGVIPSVPVDGSSARQWSEDYTDRGLKVYGGGSGNNNNDGKWFWPLALTLTAADLYAMSQADQWSAQTPAEFDDYTEVEELEIVSRPEVDFAQGVELAPVTTPAPDTGGDTGSDTGTESGNQTDYTSWFQKIIKGIEELPSKFESWITDCKTAIEELPSKFSTWFDSIVEKLSSIWDFLQTIPQTILNGVKSILSELFAPSADYIPNKVNALYEKFPYLEHFKKLGLDLKDFLIGLGVSPPIIYIDLSTARNSYFWGGREIFIDLSWYAEYKPTMDAIIGGFLWLWFAWRLWQSLPGLLQGTSGMWGDGTTVSDFTFHMPKFQQGNNWLNSGSSYHGRGTGSKWKKDGG